MAKQIISIVMAGLLVLCLLPASIRAEDSSVESSDDYNEEYNYAKPVGRSYKEQQRLYFQGENFTVNLIPLVICGVILALMAVGAFLIIDLLLNGDDASTDSGYGSGYGAPAPTGYSAPADSYGAPAQSYGAPAPSYAAPAATPSYAAPSSSYGYLKRTLNTASRVEKALEDTAELYK
jgi:hypothetical protein